MGFLSKFEGKMEDTVEGAASKMFDAPISPVQIAKKAEKQMRREKMVGAGKQYAPTLYTVLVNPDDDERLFGYYPTLAGETETYLAAKASEEGLVMDGHPLVRFIVDDALKHGKFEIIAEPVAAPIIEQLRAEEMERYGIATPSAFGRGANRGQRDDRFAPARPQPQPAYRDGYDEREAPIDPYAASDDYDYSYDYDRGYDYDYGYDERDPRAQASAMRGAAGAAGAAAAGAAGASMQAPNTVVFAGNADHAGVMAQAGVPSARLIDIAQNKAYELASMRLLIGRESTNDIVVKDINVSRTHAELRLDRGSQWVLSDLGSTNGTFVNGRQITAERLEDGDRVTFGMTNFVFSLS